ncbi:MAG: carboxypeptidase-like regulatory domain-containing protein [Planctomycetota bacterium]|jgi:hypothetical protein
MTWKVLPALPLFLALLALGCTEPAQEKEPEEPAAAEAVDKAEAQEEPAPAQQDPEDPGNRWIVTGRVTDEHGRGMAGVEVSASCGSGTLLPTGEIRTDENGDYTLKFGPGILFAGGKAGLQAAVIFAMKEGYYDRNLCRQGGLWMADGPLGQSEQTKYYAKDTVLPDSPRRLDFVMVRAAVIEGILVDESGRPLPGMKLWLTGKELPPACSVLAGTNADGQGRFRFDRVPVGFAWRFELRRAKQPEGTAFTIVEHGTYHVKIERRGPADGRGEKVLGVIEGPTPR